MTVTVHQYMIYMEKSAGHHDDAIPDPHIEISTVTPYKEIMTQFRQARSGRHRMIPKLLRLLDGI